MRSSLETYKAREDALFARWKQACRQKDGIDPDTDFASDGVLFRGEYVHIGGCWERRAGDETAQWNNAPCRLLILTKDAPCSSGLDDIRIETFRKNHTGHKLMASPLAFHRNLSLWSYALFQALREGCFRAYDDLPDWDTLREHYDTAPIARVNCKKQIGASSIDDAELGAHIERYASFLAEQVAMYDADILLCCGGGGIIKDFVKQHYLPYLKQFSSDAWVYFSPSTRKIVIDSYHPSYAKSFENMELCYTQMLNDVKAFCMQYPEYIGHRR